jgi:hypothetical protein
MKKTRKKVRRRHPLLLYKRLASYYRGPSLWLLLVSAVLLVWDHPSLRVLALPAAMTALLSTILILLTFVMSRLAYVECGEDGLLIHLPLHRVHLLYDSIVQTRTSSLATLFPPSRQPFSSRNFLRSLWQLPAVVVEVELLPQPRQQLRLWMDSRMLLKSALVLLVEDHRDLRSQIDEAMIRWRVNKGESGSPFWGG